jgi:tetraacyldisaccharide 4'-kinase
VDILLTDDGLQHYKLQRDVEIILFDGRGAGNGWLLPAGPLREPVPPPRFHRDQCAAADPALAASVGAGAPVQMRWPARGRARWRPPQRRTLAGWRPAAGPLRIAAAAGIGNPARFFGMLKAAGLHIRSCLCPTITTSSTAICRPRGRPDLDDREGCSKMCAN